MLEKPFIEIGFHKSGIMSGELDYAFSPDIVQNLSAKEYVLLQKYLRALQDEVIKAWQHRA